MFVQKFKSFTLVELLTVIAITSVLAGLLLPAVDAAREAAHSVSCRNNLHNIGIINATYRNTYHDFNLPAISPDPIGHWINLCIAQENSKNKSLYKCPALPKGALFDPYSGEEEYNIKANGSYIINACKASEWGDADLGSMDPADCYGWTTGFISQEDGSLPFTKPLRTTQVKNLSNKIFITETPLSFSGLTSPNQSCAGAYIARYDQTDHGPPITGSSYADFRNVGDHHDGKFNCLMGDNHVTQIEKSQDKQWVANYQP